MGDETAASAASGPGGPPPGPSAVPGHAPLPGDLAESARTLFGDRLPLAVAYADLLAGDGVVRGLIGPREAPRIWDRHLLNCAAVVELLPPGCSLVDVGSGAGLPGVVLAVARPDLSVVLVEPLARRAAFLTEVVEALGLTGSVAVVRARAEEYATVEGGIADVVTARAVAPLDRLAGWCLPLATVGGRLLALKGASAADEVAEHAEAVRALGGGTPTVRSCGVGLVDPPTTVVEVVCERRVEVRRTGSTRSGSGRRRSGQGPARGDSRDSGGRDSGGRDSGGRGDSGGRRSGGGGQRRDPARGRRPDPR